MTSDRFDTSLQNEEERRIKQGFGCAMLLCNSIARNRGWWSDLETGEPIERNRGEMFMLMVTELAEGFEGVRKNSQDSHLPEFSSETVELADTLIRIFDYAEEYDLPLGPAFIAKCNYNKTRSDHSIEARRQPGGKKC